MTPSIALSKTVVNHGKQVSFGSVHRHSSDKIFLRLGSRSPCMSLSKNKILAEEVDLLVGLRVVGEDLISCVDHQVISRTEQQADKEWAE